MGLFEAASGGAIFLDEIDSMPLHTQVGLLRVLQDKEIRPIGSVSMKKVDVRIIVSTQENLFELAEAGKFREDLYYRISTIIIALPLLKEKKEDIPLLANHFLKTACEKISGPSRRLLPETLSLLMSHAWPGNVRELQNTIEQAALFSERPVIRPVDIEKLIQVQRTGQGEAEARTATGAAAAGGPANLVFGPNLPTIEQTKDLLIEEALIRTNGNKSAAAELLGMTRQSLNRRIKENKS
jgi:DNA-binding NtrC family response regulator